MLIRLEEASIIATGYADCTTCAGTDARTNQVEDLIDAGLGAGHWNGSNFHKTIHRTLLNPLAQSTIGQQHTTAGSHGCDALAWNSNAHQALHNNVCTNVYKHPTGVPMDFNDYTMITGSGSLRLSQLVLMSARNAHCGVHEQKLGQPKAAPSPPAASKGPGGFGVRSGVAQGGWGVAAATAHDRQKCTH